MNQNTLKELFEYKDGFFYWKVDRGSNKVKGKIAGSVHNEGYWQININKEKYLLHRLIFLMFHGYIPEEIDHIDMNRANSKIENLRATTSSLNKFNSKKRKNKKLGSKNVFWYKRLNKWKVQMTINKKTKHIGYFDSLELAELVAMECRNKYHKEFANHG